MSTIAGLKKKKVPCEECRDQKRKCNGEKPCERCFKFNLACVYISTRSPKDEEILELARQADMVSQIETLNNQISEMESTIKTLKIQHNIASSSPSHTTPSLSEENSTLEDEEDEEDANSLVCIASTQNLDIKLPLIERHLPKRRKILQSDTIAAYLTPTDNKWSLTFKQGELCLETNITSHTDLINNLYHMVGTVELMPQIPPFCKSSVQQHTIVGILNKMIRKKYGKIHCRNIARSVHVFVTPNTTNANTLVVAKAPDSIQTTTMKLIRAYFRCQHLQHLAIHAPTLIRFTQENVSSPAIMALCAAICTMRCRHVADCLPSISLVEYGVFYFEKAREGLSDLFDQFDLETLTCYTFMTVYKLAVSQNQEANVYASMAERLIAVLTPYYQNQQDGEAVHFSRLKNHLHRIQTYQEVTIDYDPVRDKAFSRKSDLPFCTLINRSEGKWDIADDDSVQEKWFAQMHTFILKLQRAQHDASRAAESPDLFHLIGLIGHQVEMAIRHWYYKTLPSEFRLSLPLFDSTIDSHEFFSTLERECAHSAIPLLTTLAAYDEWLTLGQAYLPKKKGYRDTDWLYLEKFWDGGPASESTDIPKKWRVRIEKLMEFRKLIDFEGTDRDYLMAVTSLLQPTNLRALPNHVILSIHAAFNTIRLLKFQRSRNADCYFEMRYLMSAWHLLLRVSRLKSMLNSEVQALIPRIHKNLNTCMEIVQEELSLQPHQGMVGIYVSQMEQDLKNELDEEEEELMCECVACPNA